ncbi:MAG: hypothetical protein MJ072_03290, partial [Clostridia bacterium]|nr:hypothetical protein [Clostridia bacterium]
LFVKPQRFLSKTARIKKGVERLERLFRIPAFISTLFLPRTEDVKLTEPESQRLISLCKKAERTCKCELSANFDSII